MDGINKLSMCRLCLRCCEGLVDIFVDSGAPGFPIKETIEDLLQFKVAEDEGIPWLVCLVCLNKMNDFRLFKINCINSVIAFENQLPPKDLVGSRYIPHEIFINMEECDEGGLMMPDVQSNSYEDEIDIKEFCECELQVDDESVVCSGEKEQTNSGQQNGSTGECTLSHQPLQLRQESSGPSAGRQNVSKSGSVVLPQMCMNNNKERKVMNPKCSNENFVVHRRKAVAQRGPPYACDQCWLVFSSSEYLFKHKKFVHKGQLLRVVTSSSDLHQLLNKTSSSSQGVATRSKLTDQSNGASNSGTATSSSGIKSEGKECFNWTAPSCGGENKCCGTDASANSIALAKCLQEELPFSSFGRSSDRFKVETDASGDLASVEGNGYDVHFDKQESEEGNGKQPRCSDSMEFQCAVCGQWLSSAETLQAHLVEHTLDKPLVCKLCGIHFKWKSCLRRHLRTHSQQKPYPCEECGKRFAVGNDLKKHLRTHTSERPYGCLVCGKKFARNGDLGKHARTHTKETPYECSVCGRRFSLSGSLQGHLRTHTKERPFGCPICGKGFADGSNLRGHLRVHTGDLPYGCEICGKRFPVRRGLDQHIRTHTKEKPFPCDLCEKRFAVKGDLTRHLRVHTNEKPFSCQICGKKFSDGSNLKGHIRSHTNEKPFQCAVCQKKFTRSGNLKQHLKTHKGAKGVNGVPST